MKKLVKHNRRFMKKAIVYVQIICFILGLFSPIMAYASEHESPKVKVGFFARSGYHMEDENGTRSG